MKTFYSQKCLHRVDSTQSMFCPEQHIVLFKLVLRHVRCGMGQRVNEIGFMLAFIVIKACQVEAGQELGVSFVNFFFAPTQTAHTHNFSAVMFVYEK